MPIPLVIAGAGGIVAGIASAASASRPFVRRFLLRHRAEIEAWALQNAFEAIGLPELADGAPGRDDFTAAINAKFLAGTDFKLSNAFSRDAVKDDALAYGMRRAAQELGLTLEANTVNGARDALRGWVRDQVAAQIEAGAGDMIQNAPDAPRVLAMIQSYRKLGPDGQPAPEPGLDMTPEGISNRLRQAKFRARHKKFWVNR